MTVVAVTATAAAETTETIHLHKPHTELCTFSVLPFKVNKYAYMYHLLVTLYVQTAILRDQQLHTNPYTRKRDMHEHECCAKHERQMATYAHKHTHIRIFSFI